MTGIDTEAAYFMIGFGIGAAAVFFGAWALASAMDKWENR